MPKHTIAATGPGRSPTPWASAGSMLLPWQFSALDEGHELVDVEGPTGIGGDVGEVAPDCIIYGDVERADQAGFLEVARCNDEWGEFIRFERPLQFPITVLSRKLPVHSPQCAQHRRPPPECTVKDKETLSPRESSMGLENVLGPSLPPSPIHRHKFHSKIKQQG